MRGAGMAVLTFGLLAALTVCSAASEPVNTSGGETARDRSWLTRWFPWGKQAPPPLPEPEAQADIKPPAPPAVRAQEEATLGRRQAVCQRLREIAVQTGDDALLRKADQLEQRAFEAYLQRTAHIVPSQPALASEEELLQRRLDPPESSAERLTRPRGTRAAAGQARRGER